MSVLKQIKFTVVIPVLFLCSFLAYASEPAISYSIDDPSLEWGPCPAFFPDHCQIAVLHGDTAKPNSDILFKIPGGYYFPAHWHTSAERMVLVSGSMNVDYVGQPTTELKTGMYSYGPAKAVHSGRCISDEPCVLFIAYEGPADAIEVVSPAQ